MDKAKVFWSGRSQAVRLPKEYRVDSNELRIRRHGNAIVLEPVADGWQWLDALTGPLDEDLIEATEEQLAVQERPELDIFK